MPDQWERTRMLLGDDAMARLAAARVAIFGLGGVGGYAAEALARSGIGALDLIDDDKVSVSNLNRQIIATHSTVGLYKTDVAAQRIADIAPACTVRTHRVFFLPETAGQFDLAEYDYVVDAIDTVTGKLMLAEMATACNTPIISAMGTGNKLDPTALRIADIYDTSGCPLARIMRKELKKRGIGKLTVVYSTELPLKPLSSPEKDDEATVADGRPAPTRRSTPGSTAFVPATAGLIIASRVARDLGGL